MLELQEVTKIVGGETHIDAVTLTLEKGSLNVLLGPTLSGKTSLMRLMAGLDKPTSGRIIADGKDVTGLPVQKRDVAMVYQQFINYPSMTVYGNIASPLQVAGMKRDAIDAAVRKAADLLQLTPYLERMPLNLSGGQQQRTALARALVKEAPLVLLDEPLANLDYKLREELREELPKIFAQSGAVFVYATTEPSEALLLGGNTATLSQGRVTQFGPTVDLYRKPVDLMTARTFSDPPLNTVDLVKTGQRLESPEIGSIPLPPALKDAPDGVYTLGFQPHHIGLFSQNADAVRVSATVTASELTGSESFVHLDHGSERWVMLAHGVHDLPAGEEIEMFIDPARFLVFDEAGNAVGTDRRMAA